MKRRDLLKSTTALGAVIGAGPIAFGESPGSTKAPPSDRIGVGVIGVGNHGTANLRRVLENADAEVVALCDVFQPHLERAVKIVTDAGGRPRGYADHRRLLEDEDVDAVVIATQALARSRRSTRARRGRLCEAGGRHIRDSG
jgi:hypothetical protein